MEGTLKMKETAFDRHPKIALMVQLVMAVVVIDILVSHPELQVVWLCAFLLLICIAYTAYTLYADRREARSKTSEETAR
jgi:Ca2+/Na+ antiporter